MENKKIKRYKQDINSNIENENTFQSNTIKSNIKLYNIFESPKKSYKFRNNYDNSSMSNENTPSNCLFQMEKKMFLNLLKYNGNALKYRIRKINEIIFNSKKHIVSIFKDYLFYYEPNDFFTYYYNLKEANKIIKTVTKYYIVYFTFTPSYSCLFDFRKILNKYYEKKKKLAPHLVNNVTNELNCSYKLDFTPLINESDIKENSLDNNSNLFYNKNNDLTNTISLSNFNDNKNNSQKLSEILSKLSDSKKQLNNLNLKTNLNKYKFVKKIKVSNKNNYNKLYFENKKKYLNFKNILKETSNINIDLNYLKKKVKKYFSSKFNTLREKSLQNTSKKNENYTKISSPFKSKNRLPYFFSKRNSKLKNNKKIFKSKSPKSCHNKDTKKKIFYRNIDNEKNNTTINKKQIQKIISLENTIATNNNSHFDKNVIIKNIKNKWTILNKSSNKNILANSSSFNLKKNLNTSQSTKNYLQSYRNKMLKKINKNNRNKLKLKKNSIYDNSLIKTICLQNITNDNSKLFLSKYKKNNNNYTVNNENINNKKNSKIKLMKSNTIKNFQLNRKIGCNKLLHNKNKNNSNSKFICSTNRNSLKKLFQKKILLHINKEIGNNSAIKTANLSKTNRKNHIIRMLKINNSKSIFNEFKRYNERSNKNISLNKNYFETEYNTSINNNESKIMNKKKLIQKTMNSVFNEAVFSSKNNNNDNKNNNNFNGNKNLKHQKVNFDSYLKILKK